jgi:hypothetical protein
MFLGQAIYVLGPLQLAYCGCFSPVNLECREMGVYGGSCVMQFSFMAHGWQLVARINPNPAFGVATDRRSAADRWPQRLFSSGPDLCLARLSTTFGPAYTEAETRSSAREERKQTELIQHRIEFGWDLSQQALGILICDFQGTDSNGLQSAQQSLDFAFFAFDSPFMGELGTDSGCDVLL